METGRMEYIIMEMVEITISPLFIGIQGSTNCWWYRTIRYTNTGIQSTYLYPTNVLYIYRDDIYQSIVQGRYHNRWLFARDMGRMVKV